MYNSAALLIFMRRTTPVETSESMNSPNLFHPQSQMKKLPETTSPKISAKSKSPER